MIGTLWQGDYHHLSYGDATFDKAYAIEATCHSPTLAKAYAEICRVLKPGGKFVCCEWIMTDKYDPNNATRRKLKADILVSKLQTYAISVALSNHF